MPWSDWKKGTAGSMYRGLGALVFLCAFLCAPGASWGADALFAEAARFNAEAMELYQAGRFVEAIAPEQRALSIYEKELGPAHPYTATSLNNLAELYLATGAYGRAEPLYQRALAIREKTLGPEHPDTAASLNALAGLYYTMAAYARAEPLVKRALAITEKSMGPEHPATAESLNNLAMLYKATGAYARAEPLYQRALAIREKALGPEHPDTATSLNNFAGLYFAMGAYARAEPLYQRALAIREKALGPEHPDTAQSLNNLAMLYYTTGAYARAEPLYQRALAISEKALGPEHSETATSLNNLAMLYHVTGAYTRAEPLYQRALAITEKALGPEHPDTAQSLNNLAMLYKALGTYTPAEPLLQRALAIDEKVLGPEHPDTATSLNNLAGLYFAMGAYTRAEPLYRRALAIAEKALGPEHPDTAQSLNNLALLSWSQGNSKKALAGLQRAASIAERNTVSTLTLGDEARKRAYMQTLVGEMYSVVSLALAVPRQGPTAQALAAELIVQRKGRVLDTLADSFAALRRSLAPQDQDLLAQWRKTSARYASLLFAAPDKLPPQQYRKTLDELRARTDAQEAELARRSARFRQQVRSVSVKQVQAALPPGAVLIEWYRYAPFNPRAKAAQGRWGAPRYVAAVIAPKGTPVLVDLGDAGEIDTLVAALLIPLRSPDSSRGAFANTARELDERLMQPLRPHLGKATQLFLSPDSALNLLPFGVLVDEQGRYLAQTTTVTYLTSGRDLLRLAEVPASRQPPMVLANPDYGPLVGKAAQVSTSGRRSSEVLAGVLRFEPLEGTREEAKALRNILPTGSDVLTEAGATEAAVKRLHGPRLLHLATHAFFLDDQNLDPLGAAPLADGLPAPRGENPLLRSGLALAGANQLRSGDDDGLLTALEVSGLDLAGTQLVVLSACQTAVGDVQSGEGVYGLRRAFTLAGAETQLASLWKVDDAGTRDLMIAYYKALMAGKGRSQALHDAQLALFKDPARSHPFYWAAFVVIGNPGPIGK